MQKDRLAVAVSTEVKEEALKMGRGLGVTVSRMGDKILTKFAKTMFEEISSDIRFLENADVAPGSEKEANAMIARLKNDREPFRKLAEIFDENEQVHIDAIEAAIDEHLETDKTKKRGGK